MREINVMEITKAVKRLSCVEANRVLPQDLEQSICASAARESNPTGKAIFIGLVREYGCGPGAANSGMSGYGNGSGVFRLRPAGDVGGRKFEEAVHEGVRRGYVEGLLRYSIVADPLRRGEYQR